MTDKTSLSYKDAGVDIDAGNALVDRIKGVVKKTRRPEVMGGLGGFGALCALPQKYREPVLVSGTDGVGMVIALPADVADSAIALLNEKGENAWKIGTIKASDSEERVVIE